MSYPHAKAMPLPSVPVAEVITDHYTTNEQAYNLQGGQHFMPPPSAPPARVSMPAPAYNDAAAREFLRAHKWPRGLQDCFMKNLNKIPVRYIIADDSGSMVASGTSHRL